MKLFKPYYHIYLGSFSIKKQRQEYMYEYARSQLKRLTAIIKSNYRNTIYVPTYLCDVVKSTFLECGCEVYEYQQSNMYSLDIEALFTTNIPNGVGLLIVNYFGMQQHQDEALRMCEEHNVMLIIDNSSNLSCSVDDFGAHVYKLESHRKFYYGGSSRITGDTSALPIESIPSGKRNCMDVFKSFMHHHTNEQKLYEILKRRYSKYVSLFNTYFDEGYIPPKDNTIPAGIPLLIKNEVNELNTKYPGDCYIWPRYYDNIIGHRTLVYPIHNMTNKRRIKRDLLMLKSCGII